MPSENSLFPRLLLDNKCSINRLQNLTDAMVWPQYTYYICNYNYILYYVYTVSCRLGFKYLISYFSLVSSCSSFFFIMYILQQHQRPIDLIHPSRRRDASRPSCFINEFINYVIYFYLYLWKTKYKYFSEHIEFRIAKSLYIQKNLILTLPK